MTIRCFTLRPEINRPFLWPYVVLLTLSAAIVLLGCSNSNDNVKAQNVENLTFIFDSSFINDDLNGLTTCLVFGSQSAPDENTVPFTMTLQDTVTLPDAEPCPGEVITTFSGPADVGSIQLRIETITDENGDSVDSIVIFTGFNNDVTFDVGETIEFDVHVDKEDDGTVEFTFTNDRGSDLMFRFEIGETSAAASPDSG